MENKTRHEGRSNRRYMFGYGVQNLRLLYNEKLGLFLMPKIAMFGNFIRLLCAVIILTFAMKGIHRMQLTKAKFKLLLSYVQHRGR